MSAREPPAVIGAPSPARQESRANFSPPRRTLDSAAANRQEDPGPEDTARKTQRGDRDRARPRRYRHPPDRRARRTAIRPPPLLPRLRRGGAGGASRLARTALHRPRDGLAQHGHPELSCAHAAPRDPRRRLRRQRQGTARRKRLEHAPRRVLARPPRRRRMRAGGHRHRPLHPPPPRPCGLEHTARRRTLGPLLPERPLPLRAHRIRILAREVGEGPPQIRRRRIRRQRPPRGRSGAARPRRRRPRDRRRNPSRTLAGTHARACQPSPGIARPARRPVAAT